MNVTEASMKARIRQLPSRTILVLGLAIGLTACGTSRPPGAAQPPTPTPLTGAPATPTTVPAEPAPTMNTYAVQTCEHFRHLVTDFQQLSNDELWAVIHAMADSVEKSENPELMNAVVDLVQGQLDHDPQRFATGMRQLSKLCNVPYQ